MTGGAAGTDNIVIYCEDCGIFSAPLFHRRREDDVTNGHIKKYVNIDRYINKILKLIVSGSVINQQTIIEGSSGLMRIIILGEFLQEEITFLRYITSSKFG